MTSGPKLSKAKTKAHSSTPLLRALVEIIGETNGISLHDTLQLLSTSDAAANDPEIRRLVDEFRNLLNRYEANLEKIQTLLTHPLSDALFEFFRRFPLPYRDEHTHLTGALGPDFLWPRLEKLLNGPHRKTYEAKIESIYGPGSLPLKGPEDVDRLLRIKDGERFSRYLSVLMLPKLVMIDRDAHAEAAFHMASTLHSKYNVGFLRLKFTLSRASQDEAEQVPGLESLTEEDVVLGLYDGFMQFKKQVPRFEFTLSPSFRKEAAAFDASFKSKRDHFQSQVDVILALIDRHPELESRLCEVDTVGNERDLYRKTHFMDMKLGLRKLQYRGFRIRSHHGEVWKTLRKGIQAVDNAMNIWRIDTLEHGLSLGINPNFYFHSLFQRVLKWNRRGEPIRPGTIEHDEVSEMDWAEDRTEVRDKLLEGRPLNTDEIVSFTKAKFHTAREVEQYQHDVLNRMIQKKVTLVTLPSSNKKLTGSVEDYKDHPFSWWEKKGVGLGVGTDNYVTLDTNFIREMLILLVTDARNLKITKLLMIATGETRRPYISSLLWKMRKRL